VHDKITRHGAHVHTARRGLAPAKFFALLRARTAHAWFGPCFLLKIFYKIKIVAL
jgi:hypothetical protein